MQRQQRLAQPGAVSRVNTAINVVDPGVLKMIGNAVASSVDRRVRELGGALQ